LRNDLLSRIALLLLCVLRRRRGLLLMIYDTIKIRYISSIIW